MFTTLLTPKNIWYSAAMAFVGSLAYLNSGFKCTQVFGNNVCLDLPKWNFLVDKNITNQSHKKRFYHDDYEKYLNVFVIHHSVTDDSIKNILDNHTLFDDDLYRNDKIYYDKNSRLYGPYIEQGGENDRRFYCQYAGKEKGYGIYADLDIQKGTVIGVYTGIITNETANKDYAWIYGSSVVNGENMDISIDSRVFGNFLRFVNHDDDPNTQSVAVPYKNRWHRVYVAIKNIQANEEVTVSYGSSYWKTRDYKKV